MSAAVARFRLIRTPQSVRARHEAAQRQAERAEMKARLAEAEALIAKIRTLAVEEPGQVRLVQKLVDNLLAVSER